MLYTHRFVQLVQVQVSLDDVARIDDQEVEVLVPGFDELQVFATKLKLILETIVPSL